MLAIALKVCFPLEVASICGYELVLPLVSNRQEASLPIFRRDTIARMNNSAKFFTHANP